ncbi:MAG: GDP-mannose 4,6-dehydratase, partial [Chloroflexota bacterium]
KVALAEDGGTSEVWGDGLQTRSFCYIDDCVEGLVRIMESGWNHPINLGTDEMVTINELVDAVIGVSGKKLERAHDLSTPQGVRGRNSDNSLLHDVVNWEPKIQLEDGIARTYPWIWEQLSGEGRANAPAPRRAAV